MRYASLTELLPAADSTLAAQPETLMAHFHLDAAASGLADHQVYRSISAIYPDARPYEEGKIALLASWTTLDAARAWTPKTFDGVRDLRHRVIRVVRDYGMFDRREAPQHYSDVKSARPTQHARPAQRG